MRSTLNWCGDRCCYPFSCAYAECLLNMCWRAASVPCMPPATTRATPPSGVASALGPIILHRLLPLLHEQENLLIEQICLFFSSVFVCS